MNRRWIPFAVSVVALAVACGPGCRLQERAGTVDQTDGNPIVVIETSEGTIKAELWADKSPGTVANFLRYADETFYDGMIFHRVITGFMIQGGGLDADMKEKTTHEPIRNEARSDVTNQRGTLAMARTGQIHSASSQFFINLADNKFLNHTDETPRGFGYCVFGKVIEGMDVVDAIAKVKTRTVDHQENVPVQPVTIQSVRVIRAVHGKM